MITVTSTIAQCRQYFLKVDSAIGESVDEGINWTLEDLMDRMRPDIPVVSGNMKAGLYIENWGGGRFDLMDRMMYAKRVIELPQHQVLQAFIDDLGPFLVDNVDRAMSAHLARLGGTP